MSSLRRVVSDSDSESPSDSEEDNTKTTNKVHHRKQSEPPQEEEEEEEEEEPSKVLDSEAEPGGDSEEEETKSKLHQKQQLPKHQLPKHQQQDEGEEEDEIESESESESDHQDRKPVVQPQPRSKNAKKGTKAKGGAVKVPLVTQIISGKRGRDVNGANGLKGGAAPTEEPLTKKMRGAVGKERSKGEKFPLSPGKSPSKKERKMEQVARGSMRGTAAAAKPEKGALPAVVALTAAASSKLENTKAQAGGGKKRKASTPPPASARQQQAQKVVDGGEKSPPKPKKPFSWSSAVEESLVNELHEDCSNGLQIPATKLDRYWENLLNRLPLEEDLTGLQLCDKVRRMRQRYFTLRDRANVDGAKFKSTHEEKMYQLWTDIWGGSSGRKVSQPTVEVDQSEDESAETAATTAPRESSKRTMKHSNGEVSKDAATKRNEEAGSGAETQQGNKGEASISDDEHDEEEIELTQREPAGLHQINVTSKVVPEPVVTPFISKPRLAFTPLPPGEGKSKLVKRVEEVISDQHIEEGPPTDDEGKGDVGSSADHLKHFKEEMIRFFQEMRRSFFPGIEEQRNVSSTGGLGNLAHAGSVFVSGVLEGLGAGSESPAARELQKKWRELKIQELALVSKRLHLMQEHCRLQQEELKLQNQGLDE